MVLRVLRREFELEIQSGSVFTVMRLCKVAKGVEQQSGTELWGSQFKRAEVGGEAIKAPQTELSVVEEERAAWGPGSHVKEAFQGA